MARVDQLAKDLRRILYLLQMLKYEMEGVCYSKYSPVLTKRFEKYLRNQVGFILRDLKTSTKSEENFTVLDQDINSERLRDLHDFMEIGINCANLEELVAILRENTADAKLA